MEIFPEKRYSFTLINGQAESLERLKRRTEISSMLTSKRTDKSFIGNIKGNKFQLITSEIGKGAFVVLDGKIDESNGNVSLQINKVFKILISILFCFPLVAILIQAISKPKEFSVLLILVALIQIIFLRFIVGVFFNILSRRSLNKLRDVLDAENFNQLKV
ncbi:MAG: hypothetical protein H7195_01085 [Chryseobacterium sp.]|nr:hypothetical protein [Chryseobacterium sp.]